MLRYLDKSIEAQHILLAQAKRGYAMPELSVSFTWDHVLDNQTVGTIDTAEDGPSSDDNEWILGLQAMFPIFQGGGKHFNVLRTKSQLNQLLETKRLAEQLVEQRARNGFLAVSSSFPNMRLQDVAAEYSMKNLGVVRDKYARGQVSILDLLDAQNQAFVSRENTLIARYSFLQDVIEMQRAMSWFDFDKSVEEQAEWLNGYQMMLNEASSKTN